VRRVAFRITAEDREAVLDALLPLLPAGVREDDDGLISSVAGSLPDRAVLEAAAGGALADYAERDVPADWRERRALFGGGSVVVSDRLAIRSPYDPPPADGVIDVVVERRGSAFGSGSHPTTQMCIALMLPLEPAGGAADLGCGIGVLAIAAAKLGWAPVLACDIEPESVAAAHVAAAFNGVEVEVTRCDVRQGGPPAPTVLANLVRPLLLEVAVGMTEVPHRLIISGLEGDEPDEVVPAFERRGLVETRRRTGNNWSAIELIDSRR